MNPLAAWRRRRKTAREDLDAFLARRRFLLEDVTVFGEEMAELHLDTLAVPLSDDMRDYYRHALESYERAKAALEAATEKDDLRPVVDALVEGRHQRACVLALTEGRPLPARLEECFFNPQHGPSSVQVAWTPPGGVERVVAMCANDAQRVRVGGQPRARLVRVGDRYVPLFVAGDPIDGYFPPLIDAIGVREGIRDGQAKAALRGALPTQSVNYGSFGSVI